jgi:ATP-binding cassette, subfamily B, bacterial
MSPRITVAWSLLRGYRLRYGFALACLLATTVLNYVTPLIGSVTIDFGVAGKTPGAGTPALVRLLLAALGGAPFLKGHLWVAPVALVALTTVAGVFTYLRVVLGARATDGAARRLKERLYDHLNHLPASYHDRTETGDLVQRCTSDVETARMFFGSQVIDIANAVILAGTALPLMIMLDRRMTLVSFALVLPIIAYGYVYFRAVKHVFLEVEKAEGALTSVIQENLTGIRVVRAFARQKFEQERFSEPNRLYRDRLLRLLKLMSWYWSISDLVVLSQIGLTLVVGAKAVAAGNLTVGTLFAFLAYLGMMMWPVRQMGRVLTDLGKTSVAFTRIWEVLQVEPEPPPAAGSPPPPPAALGRILVRDLHFSHRGAATAAAGRGALNGVSFEVRPGESLAILGPSGSGKSTLAHLLLRLYDYREGEILLDGRSLASLPREWVRSQIGVVMQEPFLFSKSLRDNLRLGRGDAPDQEIEEAARAASIHDTILSFEHGYSTLIGERGITLSGGQRQRVAIARAVLRRLPILILDDALSAIDGETEELVLGALRERRGRATTLLIAHRLSTVAHADRVIVLDGGRVVQQGTPAELVSREGLYRRLWKIQTSLETDLEAELASG